MSIYTSFPGVTTPAPTNAFQTGLNQLAAQVQQLQAQTTAAGTSAYNNATLVASFNALVNTVGQYQTAVTNAGANGAPYQATLNAMDAQLNQIKTTLTTPAATPTTAGMPYGTPYGTNYGSVYGADRFSMGLNALSQQINQLQAALNQAGTSAGLNPTILANYQATSKRLNHYITAANKRGLGASNPMVMNSLNAMNAQMYQVRATLEADYRATHNGMLPGEAPTNPYPVAPYTPSPYGVNPYTPGAQNNPAMDIVGAVGAIAGLVGMFQGNNRHHRR
ncbi:MAG TPA: hypothetical protein V6D47_11020 [Oscillatoriaceae cyanobacterium]